MSDAHAEAGTDASAMTSPGDMGQCLPSSGPRLGPGVQGEGSEIDFAVKMIGYYPDTSPLIKPVRKITDASARSYNTFDDGGGGGGEANGDANDSKNDADSEAFSESVSKSKLCSFNEGSIRASVFNLCSATLGAGALSLPYTFKQAG